ncbi:MAG: hypothetical protein ACFE9Q_00275 [Candidatus Hodarchaeota archaeon]
MNVKEEIIEKTIIIKDFKETSGRNLKSKENDNIEKRLFEKVKRNYKIILAFLFFISIIVLFMIVPMVIAAVSQGLWG